eukprot:gene7706-biopygen10592
MARRSPQPRGWPGAHRSPGDGPALTAAQGMARHRDPLFPKCRTMHEHQRAETAPPGIPKPLEPVRRRRIPKRVHGFAGAGRSVIVAGRTQSSTSSLEGFDSDVLQRDAGRWPDRHMARSMAGCLPWEGRRALRALREQRDRRERRDRRGRRERRRHGGDEINRTTRTTRPPNPTRSTETLQSFLTARSPEVLRGKPTLGWRRAAASLRTLSSPKSQDRWWWGGSVWPPARDRAWRANSWGWQAWRANSWGRQAWRAKKKRGSAPTESWGARFRRLRQDSVLRRAGHGSAPL